MTRLKQKLHSTRGASMLLGLLFLLVCLTVGAVVLTAASVSAGHIKRTRQEQQDYLAVASAVELVKEDLDGAAFIGQYIETWTETTVLDYGPLDPVTNERPVTGSHVEKSPTQYLRSPDVTGLTGSELLKKTESDLIEFYYSTTDVDGSAPSMDYTLNIQTDTDTMGNVNGSLSISSSSSYVLKTTLYTGAETAPKNMTTMTCAPQTILDQVRTDTVAGAVTTVKITHTTTVTWNAPTITKGAGR